MLEHKIDNLQSAEEGEASKESQGASNGPKLVGKGDAYISDDVVVGGCVEVDLDNMERLVRPTHYLELISISSVGMNDFKAVYL